MFAFSFGPYIWPKLLSTDLFVIDYTPGWFSSLQHYNWSHGYLWFVNLALSGSWVRLTREDGTLTFGTPECMVCLMYHLVTWCLGNTFKICARSSFFFSWLSLLSWSCLYVWDSVSVSLSGILIQWCIWIPTLCVSPFHHGPYILLAIGRGLGPVPPSSWTCYFKSMDPSTKRLCCFFL